MYRESSKAPSPAASRTKAHCEVMSLSSEHLLKAWRDAGRDEERLLNEAYRQEIAPIADMAEQYEVETITPEFVELFLLARSRYWAWNNDNWERSQSRDASTELKQLNRYLEKAIVKLSQPEVQRALDYGNGGDELLDQPLGSATPPARKSIFDQFKFEPFQSSRVSRRQLEGLRNAISTSLQTNNYAARGLRGDRKAVVRTVEEFLETHRVQLKEMIRDPRDLNNMSRWGENLASDFLDLIEGGEALPF